MAYNTQFAPYEDPLDEERRRQNLAGLGGLDKDEQEGYESPAVTRNSLQLSAAQQKYKDAMDTMPRAEDYQPSKWRRFGAIVAGGLAGASAGPSMGYTIGQTIARQPYAAALQNWQQSLIPLENENKMMSEAEKQEIARRRAGAYEESARARTRTAEATERWRRAQEANLPWTPKTREEDEQRLRIMHPGPRPTAFDQFMNDPQGYTKYLDAVSKGKTQPLSLEDRMKLQENQAKMQAKYRRPLQPRQPRYVQPSQQIQAEKLAIQQVLRTNPEYQAFVDDRGGVRGPDTLPQSHWYNRTTDKDASLAREHYNQFLSHLDRKKKEILAQDQGNLWDLEQEDDEEDEEE